MYNIAIENVDSIYDYEELIKVFLMPDQYRLTSIDQKESLVKSQAEGLDSRSELSVIFDGRTVKDKNEMKRQIFEFLSAKTGFVPPWGILTGVRPVKLTGELFLRLSSYDEVRDVLHKEYLVSKEKTELLIEIHRYQQEILGSADKSSCGVYIGIPFCPTRCLYCSFTSNQKPESEIRRYLDALKKEIGYVGKKMADCGIHPESIYIGGGTPTTLSAFMLDELLSCVRESFDLNRLKEFTVEAGRPDTITKEKLEVLKGHGVERISINPQSMKEETLSLIGRSHTPSDIKRAFEVADECRIGIVNADIIAGLPKEALDDFRRTLDEILLLGPENVTVHTLAVKRASRLVEEDPKYHYRQGEIVKEMLKIADDRLRGAGYRPYYLYRQKHMAGSFENVGWCRGDTPCVYNIRIMEERQHIMALGAGGMSKIYFPNENRLERIPNVSNYEIYIERLEEMLKRKENKFFKEVEKC